MTAYDRVTAAAIECGRVVKETGAGKAMVQCPAHDDGRPSLSVTQAGEQVLLYCHAGCTTTAVVDALGLATADLFDTPKGQVYVYPDGRKVHRTPDKRFRQSGNTKGRSLYRADRITAAATVYVTEGEKDVHAIESAGGAAVCPAMGAGKANLFDWTPLRGKNAIVVADKDNPGRKHAAEVAALLDGVAKSVRIVEAVVGKDAADHVAAGKTLAELLPASAVATAAKRVEVTQLSTVTPERVEWLWPGYLPCGKLVTLDGDPGLGKSTLATAIGAMVTTAGRWPDGAVCEHAGSVLVMSAEDGLADTVRPRYDAAGADTTRVFALEGVPILTDTGERVLRPPTLADVASIAEAITDTGAQLLIVDVVMAYLPSGTDAHKDQDVRRVLAALAKVADDNSCTVLLLRHLNKGAGRDPLYRGGGSIGIVGAARAGLLVATDPDDPTRRILASVKSNLGPPPPALAYRLADAAEHGCARIHWDGPVDHTAHSLLSTPTGDDDTGALTEAQQWLEDYLTEQGEVSSVTVKRDAAKQMISERTVKRAALKLGVTTKSRGFPRCTYWSLGSQASTGETTPVSKNLGPTGPTGHDLHKQNGPTGRISQSGQGLCDGPTGGVGGPSAVPAPAVMPRTAPSSPPSPPPQCRRCRARLTRAAAIRRGYCAECEISAAGEKAAAAADGLCRQCHEHPANKASGLCDRCA